MLPLSLALFGILMELAGLLRRLWPWSSYRRPGQGKIVEVLLLTMFLTTASAALFIWGLGLPYPLIKGF